MERKSTMTSSFSCICATVALSLAVPAAAIAQQRLKDPLIGTWMLVSIEGERDGRKTEPWGSNPKGVLVMNASGRFAQIQMRSDLPKFTSTNRTKGTPEEFRATALGSLTYFGTFSVDQAGSEILFRVEYSSFPNLNGQVNRRPFTLKGDQLVTVNPASATGGSAVSLTWQRDK